MKWYVLHNNRPIGPYSKSRLQKLINDHQIASDPFVWSEKFSSWKRVSEIKDFDTLPDDQNFGDFLINELAVDIVHNSKVRLISFYVILTLVVFGGALYLYSTVAKQEKDIASMIDSFLPQDQILGEQFYLYKENHMRAYAKHKGPAVVKGEFKSIANQVTSLEPIEFKSISRLKGRLIDFRNIEFVKGKSIARGKYMSRVELIYSDSTLLFEQEIYIGDKPLVEFDKTLQAFNKTNVDTDKDNFIEIQQFNMVFLSILSKLQELYISNIARFTKGKSISFFETRYSNQISPLYENYVNDLRSRYQKIEKNTQLFNYYKNSYELAIQFGKLVTDIIDRTRKLSTITKQGRENLISFLNKDINRLKSATEKDLKSIKTKL